LGGGTAEAWGINDKGQVVGWASTTGGDADAVGWKVAGTPILDLQVGANSCALRINNTGQIVGTAPLSPSAQAFFWDPLSQTAQTLVNSLGGAQSWGNAINDQGQVVGNALDGSGNQLAYLWDPGTKTMHNLGTLGTGAQSWANAINYTGQIVGTSENGVLISGDKQYRPFLRDPATGSLQDLGDLGGGWGAAYAINNRGQVAGWASVLVTIGQIVYNYPHAFFLPAAGQQMQDLGTLTGTVSNAWWMNELGQVVGQFGDNTLSSTVGRAFVWTPGDTMQDLNNLVMNLPTGVTLACAYGINSRGQIVGSTSNDRAFLLTPINALPWLPLLLN
jgi:probable HAF family extracellular repeat protein